MGWAGRNIILTGMRARNEPEATVLQHGVLHCNPQAQHSAEGLRVQEGSILVRGDCRRPTREEISHKAFGQASLHPGQVLIL